MSLGWPLALLALLVVPLLLLARWWFNRRRKRTAITVSSIGLIRAAIPGRSAWRRRIPVALFLVGLALIAASVARPEATVSVPRDNTSIILAMDASGSMCSTDVDPNRLTAAIEAARAFIEQSDDGTRIGLVAFAGIAGLLVPPTTEKDQLVEALESLKTSRGTAIGQAILTSIDTIAEYNPNVTETGVDLAAPTSKGDYEPDTIVILTDGSNTTGVAPLTAAEQAAARRLRVFTIGFGTTEPAAMVCTADQVSGDNWRGGGGGFGRWGDDSGLRRRVMQIDEETLTAVADTTGGKYFRAEDAGQLTEVLTDLPSEIGLHEAKQETTVWFVLFGTLLTFAGVGLSMWWNRGRPVRALG
ncbi:VWA domain-containing protein [Herbidospora mongoliensis]|uniref:VWA domain-containing protein n=1 Tax=Herbidospora mongoliensis TaxID=688067 RepID=UPI000835EB06|nr:VWA domain-containing protein [Herbidospora mongoliensis]